MVWLLELRLHPLPKHDKDEAFVWIAAVVDWSASYSLSPNSCGRWQVAQVHCHPRCQYFSNKINYIHPSQLLNPLVPPAHPLVRWDSLVRWAFEQNPLVRWDQLVRWVLEENPLISAVGSAGSVGPRGESAGEGAN